MRKAPTPTQIENRKTLMEATKQMLKEHLEIKGEDDHSIMTTYKDYLLHISFTELHPLMVFCLCRPIDDYEPSLASNVNDTNLRCVLGSHFINEEMCAYTFRATHWLEKSISMKRFYEILDRCVEEANRGYFLIVA